MFIVIIMKKSYSKTWMFASSKGLTVPESAESIIHTDFSASCPVAYRDFSTSRGNLMEIQINSCCS